MTSQTNNYYLMLDHRAGMNVTDISFKHTLNFLARHVPIDVPLESEYFDSICMLNTTMKKLLDVTPDLRAITKETMHIFNTSVREMREKDEDVHFIEHLTPAHMKAFGITDELVLLMTEVFQACVAVCNQIPNLLIRPAISSQFAPIIGLIVNMETGIAVAFEFGPQNMRMKSSLTIGTYTQKKRAERMDIRILSEVVYDYEEQVYRKLPLSE